MLATIRIQCLTLLAASLACSSPSPQAPTVTESDWSAPDVEESPLADTRDIQFTFGINCHDFVNIDNSGDALLRFLDIFAKHGVMGDFYLTESVLWAYLTERLDVADALVAADIGLAYHVRAPHPFVYPSLEFDALRDAKDPAAAVRRVETHRLDLLTALVDETQVGGVALLAQVFGRGPTVATPLIQEKALRSAALSLYQEYGASMIVTDHEGGTPLDEPYRWEAGMLQRPSHFSVTRWDSKDGKVKNRFWWGQIAGSHAADFDPVARFDEAIATLPKDGHVYFGQALIHEDNVYIGNTPFIPVYYEDKEATTPKSPPYDLTATAPWLKWRSAEETEAIFAAWEALVAHVAAHPRVRVVLASDVVAMAARGR